mgnify:CR=1 FL=1
MKPKIIMIAIAVSVAAIALVGFTADSTTASGYDIGDVATDFSLKNIDNQMVSLADYKDAKGYIVIFSCNTCPYVVAYEDRMIDLHNKYSKKGFPVIAINPNDPSISPGDSYKEMQVRAREKKFPFAYVFDEKQEVFRQYGATRTPHVYLLEKTAEGNVVRYIGAIDDNFKDASAVKEKFVENAVDALLKDTEINTKTTKAIGCTIKYQQ